MQPALDEVQQAVNKAAQLVLGVAKGIAQWNKERKSKVANKIIPKINSLKGTASPGLGIVVPILDKLTH